MDNPFLTADARVYLVDPINPHTPEEYLLHRLSGFEVGTPEPHLITIRRPLIRGDARLRTKFVRPVFGVQVDLYTQSGELRYSLYYPDCVVLRSGVALREQRCIEDVVVIRCGEERDVTYDRANWLARQAPTEGLEPTT